MNDVALETLLDRRAGFLAFVERRVADPALAEDILQAAYMRAVEKAGKLRAEESTVAWFYSVLRNAVVDFYRRRATEGRVLDASVTELDVAVPDEETRTFVCGCIAHVLPMLKPAYAEILREVDLEDVPLGEFAKRHKVTPGNAAVRVHRARAALKRELIRVCGACTIHACLNCCCKGQAA
jgi:RNA polymerase sigma factor (sigma-70 family)